MAAGAFHLDPPPSFRGLQPDIPITIYHRHLPHWRQAGATYFVTFRLNDSLPQSKLQFLRRLRDDWERRHPEPCDELAWKKFAREYTNSVERWLDEGYGQCHFRELRFCTDLRDRLHHFQGQKFFLSCWAILPNHCHIVIQPYEDHALEDLLGAMKGVNARHVNAALGRKGAIWQDESFDRIVRDEKHLWRVVQYIGRNPRMAGLRRRIILATLDPSNVASCGLAIHRPSCPGATVSR